MPCNQLLHVMHSLISAEDGTLSKTFLAMIQRRLTVLKWLHYLAYFLFGNEFIKDALCRLVMEVLPDKIYEDISVLFEDSLDVHLEGFHGVFCSRFGSIHPRHGQADGPSLCGTTTWPSAWLTQQQSWPFGRSYMRPPAIIDPIETVWKGFSQLTPIFTSSTL